MTQGAVDYDAKWGEWGDMIRYSPAPYHRRRLMLELADGLRFDSVLDVGCGNAELLLALRRRFPHARLSGADLSAAVIEENRRRCPDMSFATLDLGQGALDESADLVVCSEVVEHVADWEAALRHLRAMCRRHLILTVPAGKLFPIDTMVGHVRHFDPETISGGLARAGFSTERLWQWGFPLHTLYKTLINLAPGRTMNSFAGQSYGPAQKLVAAALTATFHLNFKNSRFGRQLVVLAATI